MQQYMQRYFEKMTKPDGPLLKMGLMADMQPSFVSCDAEKNEVVFRFPIFDWELNPQHVLNGGIISSAMDTTVGTLVYYLCYPNPAVTTNLQATFHAPVFLEQGEYFVKATLKHQSRSLLVAWAEVYADVAQSKVYASASITFKVLYPRTTEQKGGEA